MNRNLRSIRDCLFSAFANSYSDPQDDAQMWAIFEGMKRVDPHRLAWRSVTSRKEHTCIRGCHIADRTVYFKHLVGGGWGSDWKFCAGCMAMILYFKEVDKMPPRFRTHWDPEKKEAVFIEEEAGNDTDR